MFVELFEALKDSGTFTGKLWRARILEANVMGSSAYYPADVLERDGAKAFPEGTPVYMNHPTQDEKWNQPERDAEKLIGYLATEAQFESDGLHADIHIYADKREWLMERYKRIGLSIIAKGEVEETADGPRLVALTHGQSVDVVTRAGAGGKFVQVLESAKEDPAPKSGADLKEKEVPPMDPKLLAALDALVEANNTANANIGTLTEAVTALTKRAADEDAAKAAALAEAEKVNEPKAPSFAEIDKALNESELPAAARATVLAAVEAGADLAESITAKVAEVEAVLTEAGKFSGNVKDDKANGASTLAETMAGITGNIYGS